MARSPSNPNLRPGSPLLAGILSFLSPGLGQVYNGDWLRVLVVVVLLLATGLGLGVYCYVNHLPPSELNPIWFALIGAVPLLSIIDAASRGRRLRTVGWKRTLAVIAYYFFFTPALIGFVLGLDSAIPYGSVRNTSSGMEPGLTVGKVYFVDEGAYKNQGPARGDIVSFRYPRDESVLYAKRVIGLPGDKIEMRKKLLFLNGKPVDTALPTEKTVAAEDGAPLSPYEEDLGNAKFRVLYSNGSNFNSEFGPVTVPAGNYFVLGDNRDRSADSRLWGTVKAEQIEGKISP
jgi:signal peptidase I